MMASIELTDNIRIYTKQGHETNICVIFELQYAWNDQKKKIILIFIYSMNKKYIHLCLSKFNHPKWNFLNSRYFKS